MDKIDSIEKLEQPQFIKPIKINYTQKNIQRTWEAVISHDSVCVVLWHEQRDSLIVVKQLRVTVLNSTKKDGYTYELCAGIVDKNASLAQIAKEEVLEECGYDIPTNNFTRLSSYFTSVGISGARQTLFYATCDDSMIVSEGGGLEDEDIEVIYIALKDAKKFMFDESYQKTPGMIMAFYWFFDNIKKPQ